MPAFKSHTTGTTDVAWDGPEQKTKVRSGENRAYYGKIYAWYDPGADEGNKSDYKFIHHMVGADGTPGDANTNGCSAGIGILNGGRTGTTIPDADRRGVYDHLAKHIRDAGKEPPELQSAVSDQQSAVSGQQSADAIGVMGRGEIMRLAALEPWAILPTALQQMLATAGVLHEKPDEYDEYVEIEAMSRPGPKTGRVARIPVMGAITRRDSIWSMLFGGTSIERLTKTLREVAEDETIGTVLLDIDSPGGTVSGMPELAAEVKRLRASKHVVALANSLTASAAYWIAAQADEIVATPEALVGSVGVFAVHEDWSAFYEKNGVKISYISAGRYKTEGNFDEPLTDEARAHMQTIVDDAYELFIGDVAKGRQIAPSRVRAEYGEGRVLTAKDAKAAGMIDRIAGADETVRRLAGVKAEGEGQTLGSAPTSAPTSAPMDGVNSQARIALMRRRLELAQKYFEED
ncbi:MAG: signal peptide peptidase SppA [Deltaproteobacteria bacterium]